MLRTSSLRFVNNDYRADKRHQKVSVHIAHCFNAMEGHNDWKLFSHPGSQPFWSRGFSLRFRRREQTAGLRRGQAYRGMRICLRTRVTQVYSFLVSGSDHLLVVVVSVWPAWWLLVCMCACCPGAAAGRSRCLRIPSWVTSTSGLSKEVRSLAQV